jgi:glycosyltransferase involved in cell wall biosynthesis
MLDLADLQRSAGHTVELWGMSHPENVGSLALRRTFAPFIELEPPPGGLKRLTASARMIWSAASRRGMERALESFQPDVVHLHNIYHQLSPSILAPIRRKGVPSVMTLHDYKLACPSYQMLNHGRMCDLCVTGGTWHAAVERCKGDSRGASAVLAVESGIHRALHSYSSIDIMVAPSQFLCDVMSRAGFDADRLRVVSNVVQVQPQVRPPPSRPTGSASFVFAGRLNHEKGLDTLIRAVELCRDDISVQVAGEGPERLSSEQLASRRSPGRVHFLGRLDKSALMTRVAGAVALVVPSRWYENQPMTVLEAFAVGVPVIASDLGGLPELVTDGQEGLLVPHNDPHALAAAMTRLADDQVLAYRMGQAAQQRFVGEFTATGHVRAISEVYHCAKSRHAQGSPR